MNIYNINLIKKPKKMKKEQVKLSFKKGRFDFLIPNAKIAAEKLRKIGEANNLLWDTDNKVAGFGGRHCLSIKITSREKYNILQNTVPQLAKHYELHFSISIDNGTKIWEDTIPNANEIGNLNQEKHINVSFSKNISNLRQLVKEMDAAKKKEEEELKLRV